MISVFPPETFNDLRHPEELYKLTQRLFDGKEFMSSKDYPRILIVQARLPMERVIGLADYRCPVCGVKFMPGMEVVRMDHYNEDKTAFLSQLLHISCVEKILYMSRRSRKRAGVGEQAERDSLLQQEAIVHTWHTLGRRFRGDTWEEILPYSIVRAYVKAKEDGLVKNVDEFLEGEKL